MGKSPKPYLSWNKASALFARLSPALNAREAARLERAATLIRSTAFPNPRTKPDAFGAAFVEFVTEANLSGDEAVQFFQDIQVWGVESGKHRAATRLEWIARACRDRDWLLGVLASRQPHTNKVAKSCPCCGYATLTERASFEICPVCFWEDDGSETNPDEISPPNGISLREARRNFAEFGASDAGSLAFVRHPSENERRGYRLVPLPEPGNTGGQPDAP